MRALPENFRPTPIMLLALIACATLSAGCPKRIVLPDDGQMHQIAKDVDVTVWCHGPTGIEWTRCETRAARGWWLVPPSIMEGE